MNINFFLIIAVISFNICIISYKCVRRTAELAKVLNVKNNHFGK